MYIIVPALPPNLIISSADPKLNLFGHSRSHKQPYESEERVRKVTAYTAVAPLARILSMAKKILRDTLNLFIQGSCSALSCIAFHCRFTSTCQEHAQMLRPLQSAGFAVAFGQEQAAASLMRLILSCFLPPGHPAASSLTAPVAVALLTPHRFGAA